MSMDPVTTIIVVLAAIATIAAFGKQLAKRNRERAAQAAERRAKEEAEEEERQRALWEKQEAERKEHEAQVEAARERMIIAEGEIARAQDAFRETHDALVDSIRKLARVGCDAAFRQRFGVTRPPHGDTIQEDEEVQAYLRENYAELRDAAIAEMVERLLQEETDRRFAAAREETEEEAEAREEVEARVREYWDADSLRTYMLAAISARYSPDGKPTGDLPWPAYTAISPRGFGELALAPGAPARAQDAYCELAWRKFHIGRRAEKPGGGEYSWPESHELGDADAGTQVDTPAGAFSATAGGAALPLREMTACSWVRHDLAQEGSLLVPDCQRSLLVNLEGLRKGARIDLRFDCEEAFLQEAPEGTFALNAVGQAGAAFVGMSVSKPEAASLGDAPYELVARDGLGFAFRMTADARRHDDDMYPQFIQVNLSWCAPPSLEPEAVIRHIAR